MRTLEFGDVPKRTGHFESFDGTPIYYEVRGEGAPVVLCYGIACLINHWTHQLRYFSHGYQTIVFDYRGHHGTPTPRDRKNLSITAICKDLHGLLHHLGISRASFWGHSFGAQMLTRYYELYPNSVANLVLINGFVRNPLPGVLGIDAAQPVLRLFKEHYRKRPSLISKIWRASVSNPLAIQIASLAGGFNLQLTSLKNIEVYARGVAAMDLDVFITLFEDMIRYDGTPVLNRINVPTLLISGEKDGVTPRAQQQEIHERIRGSEILYVPYGSHCTQLDMPDFVNLRIEKFLAENNYPATATKPFVATAAPRRAGARRKKKPWDEGTLD